VAAVGSCVLAKVAQGREEEGCGETQMESVGVCVYVCVCVYLYNDHQKT
jgi:hypothetical protein